MKRKPIIGIVAKHIQKPQMRPDVYIRDEVKQAVFDNGGIAIGILTSAESVFDGKDIWHSEILNNDLENIAQEISLCDGIIFQGGAAYDDYETEIAKYCYEHDIPTMGICCGQNALVRALGGKTRSLPNPEKHNQPEAEYVHKISVVENSKFGTIVECKEMLVNSRHKRAVYDAPFLNVAATDDDGNIEVVEAPDRKFYIGMRFHPESLYKTDAKMRAIFEKFIEVCGEE